MVTSVGRSLGGVRWPRVLVLAVRPLAGRRRRGGGVTPSANRLVGDEEAGVPNHAVIRANREALHVPGAHHGFPLVGLGVAPTGPQRLDARAAGFVAPHSSTGRRRGPASGWPRRCSPRAPACRVRPVDLGRLGGLHRRRCSGPDGQSPGGGEGHRRIARRCGVRSRRSRLGARRNGPTRSSPTARSNEQVRAPEPAPASRTRARGRRRRDPRSGPRPWDRLRPRRAAWRAHSPTATGGRRRTPCPFVVFTTDLRERRSARRARTSRDGCGTRGRPAEQS